MTSVVAPEQNVDTNNSTRSTRSTAWSHRPLSSGDLWLLFAATVIMIVGLQLDAYAHATQPALETFFTPWHGVMYLGMLLCGATIGWFVRRNLKAGATSLFAAIPKGMTGAVAGMAILAISGGIDTAWHTSFGIETGLEISLSPSHLGIISGMFLVASSPMAVLWKQARLLTASERSMMVASAGLAFTTVHIITTHASMLGVIYLGRRGQLDNDDANVVHGLVFSTALLIVPMIILRRRFGVGSVGLFFVTLVPSMMMWFMNDLTAPVWVALTPAVTAALALPTARVVAAFGVRVVQSRLPKEAMLTPHPALNDVMFGVLFPLMMWATIFVGAVAMGRTMFWTVHVWTGVLSMTALAGGLTALANYGILRVGEHTSATPPTAGSGVFEA
jgi:hypothetical protein